MEALERATGEPLDLKGKADLVLDSNIVLQLYSCHDLFDAYETAHGRAGEAGAATDPELRARLERLRDALLFAIRCHEEGTRTVILSDEPLRVLLKRVPPEDTSLFERFFVQFFLYCVKDRALGRWEAMGVTPKRDVKGTAADDYLLDLAEANGLPLITDEGNRSGGPFGTNAKGAANLRGKGEARGVPVYTPGEWWRRPDFDDRLAGPAFAARFNAATEAYRRERKGDPGAPRAIGTASWIYQTILDGRFPTE